MAKMPNPFDVDWSKVELPPEKPAESKKPDTMAAAARALLTTSNSEVTFSFDTTASMYPCLESVREEIGKTCDELFALFPGLRIGLVSHGDYCDGQLRVNSLPLTDDREAVKKFIRNTPLTGGGDSPECYELALHTARGLGWTEGKNKMLVLIGDDEPHGPDFPGNDQHLDWRQELAALNAQGVKTFPMQCLYYPHRATVNSFWEEVAKIAGTDLIQFAAGQNFASFATGMVVGKIASAHGGAVYAEYCGSPVGAAHNSKLTAEARASNALSAAKYDEPNVVWVDSPAKPEEDKA